MVAVELWVVVSVAVRDLALDRTLADDIVSVEDPTEDRVEAEVDDDSEAKLVAGWKLHRRVLAHIQAQLEL